MDIRTTPNPAVRWAGRKIEEANARHPWSHNDHFHRWILRSLPPGSRRLLDVGCGRGSLIAALQAELGGSALIEGIDPDPRMALSSAERFRGAAGVRIRRASLADIAAEQLEHDRPGEPGPGPYDAITMIASLHHMTLEPALVQAAGLLRPGGRLLAVALVRPHGALDGAWDIVNALTNPLIGLVKHPRRATPGASGAEHVQMPLRDPDMGVAELRERARAVLPGARVHRREGFRVTMSWTRPD